MKPIKICFISLRSYPLFIKRSTEYFGGAEVQMSLIVKELAKSRQFKVSLITRDYGQKKVVLRNKVKIKKTKINPFDFFKVLKTINADVYVERIANIKVFLVGLFCKMFKKKFVYMVAHDDDVSNKWLYYFGLKYADLVVAQTKKQSLKLKQNFKIKSIVMLSMIGLSSSKRAEKRKYVLWVGRADDWKRPLVFIDLAKKNPKQKFVMICRIGNNQKLLKLVKDFAQKQINLKFYPVVPISKIFEFFHQAKVFINTSLAEGFPNTFLQAGMAKTPILSLSVNPDNFINQFNCGYSAKNSQETLEADLNKLINRPKLAKNLGKNNYDFVVSHHSLTNLKIFKRALKQLL